MAEVVRYLLSNSRPVIEESWRASAPLMDKADWDTFVQQHQFKLITLPGKVRQFLLPSHTFPVSLYLRHLPLLLPPLAPNLSSISSISASLPISLFLSLYLSPSFPMPLYLCPLHIPPHHPHSPSYYSHSFVFSHPPPSLSSLPLFPPSLSLSSPPSLPSSWCCLCSTSYLYYTQVFHGCPVDSCVTPSPSVRCQIHPCLVASTRNSVIVQLL